MKAKTKEMLKKAESILREGMPISARQLASKCGLKESSGYRMVRLLRENGVGIIPSKTGYLLADHAEKRDDVYFLRRLNGRRTSDFIALRGCVEAMRKRWKGIEHNEFKQIIAPLYPSYSALNQSLTILQQKSERLGI